MCSATALSAANCDFDGGAEPIGGPWQDSAKEKFFIPFVFSTNGRPYLRQIETESGIWFRDTRKPFNHRRALSDWPTPDGLKGMLEIDAEAARNSPVLLFGTPDEVRRELRSRTW